MSESNQTNALIRSASIRNGLILGLFSLLSTGLIALTFLVTKDKIATEVESALARRLNEVISSDKYDNDFYRDCALIEAPELSGTLQKSKIYRMRANGAPYALFITATAPDGYAGKIKLIVGIYTNGSIAGVRVTEHQETPGLGDKIELQKSNWINQFDGKSFSNLDKSQWAVKKDGGYFDALTGATITPRAIIKTVTRVLNYYQLNSTELFSLPSSCGAK